MTPKERSQLNDFLQAAEKDDLKNYLDKVWDNLKELNQREEKYGLWFILIFFFYLVLKNTYIETIIIGPVTFKDLSPISKIMPLVFIFIFFNLHAITKHKKQIAFTLNLISNKLYELESNPNLMGTQFSNSIVSRILLPFSISNALSKLYIEKPKLWESLIGFPLLLPVILIGLVPYLLSIYMIWDLWKNFRVDFFGHLCFWLALWALLLLIFYTIKNAFHDLGE